jgi:IS30 family transposase
MERQYTHLDQSDRKIIMHYWELGESVRAIARMLRRSPSTVLREIKRNREPWGYDSFSAQNYATSRSKIPRKAKKLDSCKPLQSYVLRGIYAGWSPQQIAGRLQKDHPENMEMRISHETIYVYIYAMPRGQLRKELTHQLRCKHTNRRKIGRAHNSNRGKILDMISIHDRPKTIDQREVAGHWEGDLIVGTKNKSAVGTLVERKSRYLILAHLENKTAEKTRLSFARKLSELPLEMRKSLTYDQGKEMSQHKILSQDVDIAVYFCDPHAPWQRGTNENTNGLIRQYLPKGSDLSHASQEYLDEIASRINNRPRKILEFKTPQEVYLEEINQYHKSNGVAL